MGLSERYEKALERERVAVSFRTPEAKEVMKKVFQQAEGNTISDRIISVLKKGLEAESKDRTDRVYRQDEGLNWAKYLEGEPISKDSSREEKDEWFEDKADELNERLDSIESELKNDFNMGGKSMKADENEKIKNLRDERTEKFNDKSEELVEFMEDYREDGLNKVEALRKARIELFQGEN